MYIGAVADDLTGATDLALTFSREGFRVLQIVGVPEPDTDFSGADAVVVALKSRTAPVQRAVEESVTSANALLGAGARQLFFKYCSTFDSTDEGNIGPVTDALLALLGEKRTIVCPAFPTNKRTLYKGYLFVGDVLLSESSMKDHPLTPMRDANLVRVLERQTETPAHLIGHETVSQGPDAVRSALDGLEGMIIVDAVSDGDLRTIGTAASSLRLVTGGSGIALGLPANFKNDASSGAVEIAPDAGGSVILAGSCSIATRGQITLAVEHGLPSMMLDPVHIAQEQQTVGEAAEFVMQAQAGGHTPLVYSSADPEAVRRAQNALGSGKAGKVIEQFLSELAAELMGKGITRFVVAGGETSGAVVGGLGLRALRVGPEIDPGVPWMQSSGDGRVLALALKSGNFGSPDFFLKAWEHLR